MSRPDWVVCIRKPKADEEQYTWCGGLISMEFTLTGLDHAACLQESRLAPCAGCVAAATSELLKLATPAAGYPRDK